MTATEVFVDCIDADEDEFGVEPICRALTDAGARIAPSTYYAARTRPPSDRAVVDTQLKAGIVRVHAANLGVYGARKVWRALNRDGTPVVRCRVERLMRQRGLAGAAWSLGDAARTRRLQARALAERARDAERNRNAHSREAVTTERLRIARELHDVMAHSMSVIAVQAGVGRHVMDRDPETARTALGVIEDTNRRTLTEMRQLLGVLRVDDRAATGPAAAQRGSRTPQPGLARLDDLLADARAAGLEVTLSVTDTAHPGSAIGPVTAPHSTWPVVLPSDVGRPTAEEERPCPMTSSDATWRCRGQAVTDCTEAGSQAAARPCLVHLDCNVGNPSEPNPTMRTMAGPPG